MKKLLLLVSCCAAVFILSQVSFAQEAVIEPVVPCTCVNCEGAPSPFAAPFAYPPQRQFGNRLAAAMARRSIAPQMLPPAAPIAPVADCSAAPGPIPYPYGVSDLRPRSVRRVARLTPHPQPVPAPYPVAVMPPVAPAPIIDLTPGAYAPGPIAQTGLRNMSVQRSGSIVPVINFLSVVRAPRDGYYSLPGAPF